ncbi:LysM peptidoglycan-binding domain-containing protein [Flavobacterium sp. MFBS3-15]|uniref:PBP1 and LysM peptidoglycan-binding domain-containing protein n=1 Tax=Flavobacterium sp. MFBS3-15 TaxID=2989816 RepID=UPI0022367413|nr:LysM peptidoglycan-binding domain-containing protein [Flavobacterium sp. MFBS3-15]MCW4468027.1 LysM peptidoglycan-binding domain-containing protein [Flavobacterium sp. MFBS3-15]
MKYFLALLFSVVLFNASAQAQDYKKHTVKKGETITAIAKQYQVTPYDISRLNPDVKNGLKEGSTLLIPALNKVAVKAKETPTRVANTIHTVEPKETLYSLSKKYNVSVEDIEKANSAAIKDGLKEGQQIIIPIKGSGVAAQAKAAEKADAKKGVNAYIYHIVEVGETKYSIAKKHGITVQLIEELNPAVKDTLPLGFNLKLVDNNAVKGQVASPVTESAYAEYIVQPKETLYSIIKRSGMTEAELVKLNPDLKDGLKDGMTLKLPSDKVAALNDTPARTAPTTITDLSKSIKKSEPREIALLLPFNMSRIESDTVRRQLLRSDRFLNMTLDFYAGAMMAIDSAKVMGLPLKVRIYDSKESKNGSDVNGLASSLSAADAVIGPFYQSNAENAAALLASKKIPVISPLSKDEGKPYNNLFNSIPQGDEVKMVMMEYLKSKHGNIIAVVDPKKASARDFIKANCPSARFIDGTPTEAILRSYLVAGKINYVILESESTGMVLTTTKLLVSLLPDYQIQLVVSEITDALENDEMPMERLAKLKMLYPSGTRENDSQEATIFRRVFKEKNGIMPSQFATRGFDVTFDTILRIFQEDGFTEGADTIASEQVENKFRYVAENGGNYNTGVYILQYDEDFTIKQAQ